MGKKDSNKITKVMLNKHRIEYFVFIIFGKLLTIFGFHSIKSTSKILAFLFFHIFKIRRQIVLNNLTIAFPKLTSSEINKLAYKNYKSIATTFLEIFSYKKLTKEDMKNIFSNKNFHIILEKYNENKGLIILTAHFGNWEYGAVATGLHLNLGINVLVKRQKNPYVAKWLNGFREQYDNVQINLGVSVRELYKTITDKKIVGIVGDQRGKRDGIKVNFFGQTTRTFPGTAAIAIKTQCPVLVMFCARQNDGNYEAIIEEINHLEFQGTKEEKIQQFNQKYMSILEKSIRKYPEQWFWMHNIWKY
ncbi:MAG: lysophospholipid acyltransferase family protein [Ignavibacteriae bacterium]|nr:lysophospholipid acyltransferase family protein [Ignavibacteriota bacterium]